ncbi:MAG TPA: choice-of-anchor Q domain-containing protein [Xanthomonadales bacterium]|nr:choice-of-anchor Q domain-containing protein [Xanthomonadales bacterium]
MKRTILALALLAALPAHAATRTWPSLFGGPCPGTLQDCINGAAPGDTVLIGSDDIAFPDRYTLIDEEIGINKSLILRAAPGIDAVFAANQGIFIGASPTPVLITLSDLAFRRGGIQVSHTATSGSSIYLMQRLRFDDSDQVCAIDAASNTGTAAAAVQVLDSTFRFRTPGPTFLHDGICIDQRGSSRSDYVGGNRIESDPGASNIGVRLRGTAGGAITIQRNAIVGDGFVTGIDVGATTGTGRQSIQVDNNVVAGQRQSDLAQFGAGIYVRPDNADVVVANNSVVRGTRGLEVFGASPAASIAGRVANNVVAFHSSEGLFIVPGPGIAVTNRDNLVYASNSNGFTAGPGTLTVDPLVLSTSWPRLSDSSPAINAGDNASAAPVSEFDADGEARIALATIDIGAFEANADIASQETAVAATTIANQTLVNVAGLVPADRLFVTPRRTAAGAPVLAEQLGTYLSGSQWLAYLEDNSATVPPGYAYNLISPVASKRNFTHVTSPASVFEDTSQLTDPELDSRPFAIAALAHLYQLGGGPASYHDFPIGLEYVGTRWFIRNQDGATMQSNRNFHVMIAPLGSPNAFRARTPFATTEIRLEHPLLDDNACAAFVATRVDDPDVAGRLANPVSYSLDYRAGGAGAPGRWFIVSEGAGAPAFPANAAFNVIVDGQQANRCRAPQPVDLFANGFE